MVKWQKFVSLVFEVGREKGVEFDSLEESQEAIEVASQHWEDVPELRTANVSEARDYLREQL